MTRPTLLLAASTLDWTLGDPESLPHPVRLMGTAITRAEPLLRRPADSPTRQLLTGALLAGSLVSLTYTLTSLLIQATRRIHPALGIATEVLLAASTLAARNLHDEARAVLRALEAGDLPHARLRLARIVGRDTAHLDPAGISRALIETLAESASDGIVAPLFFLTLGGAPLAMAFKAVSTMDSMIGHRTPRYLFFGRPAARLDDLANLLPARLTAALILLAAGTLDPHTLATYRRDCTRHASPNAGHPEAAIAAALRIQLGGRSTYAGEPHHAPLLNPGAPLPTPADARRALRLVTAVSLLAAALATLLTLPRRPLGNLP